MKTETLLIRLADDVQKDLKALGIDKVKPPAEDAKLTQIYRSGVGLVSDLNEWETRHARFKALTKPAIEDRVTVRPMRALTAAANAANIPIEKLTEAIDRTRLSGVSPDKVIAALTDLSDRATPPKANPAEEPFKPEQGSGGQGKPKKSEK